MKKQSGRSIAWQTETIRNTRLRKGLSQQQVATLIGVHIRQYQRLEYGERSLEAVCMRFGLAVCAILELDPFEMVPWPSGEWELVPREE